MQHVVFQQLQAQFTSIGSNLEKTLKKSISGGPSRTYLAVLVQQRQAKFVDQPDISEDGVFLEFSSILMRTLWGLVNLRRRGLENLSVCSTILAKFNLKIGGKEVELIVAH